MSSNQFIQKNFDRVWPVHLAHFTKLLIQLRERFDGDLDLMLVLAVIGGRTRPETWRSELVLDQEMTTGENEDARQLPINVQSVAEYSGIPRETVRRKVSILQSKGWVTRDSDGLLSVSNLAAKSLVSETETTIAYLEALRMTFDDMNDGY